MSRPQTLRKDNETFTPIVDHSPENQIAHALNNIAVDMQTIAQELVKINSDNSTVVARAFRGLIEALRLNR